MENTASTTDQIDTKLGSLGYRLRALGPSQMVHEASFSQG